MMLRKILFHEDNTFLQTLTVPFDINQFFFYFERQLIVLGTCI